MRILSFIIVCILLASLAYSCAPAGYENHFYTGEGITASSTTADYGTWISDRLGTVSDNVILGIGTSDEYGIDMSSFEDDGYIIKTVGNDVVILGKTDDGLDRACRKYVSDIETYGSAVDTVYHEGYRIDNFMLFGNPVSEFSVTYSKDHNDDMLFAVSEFVRLTESACGVRLEGGSDNTDDSPVISFVFSDDPELSSGGYRYYEENGSLIIEGDTKFGCSNAVYRFFENECGWDGLTYGDSVLAEADTLDIPAGIDKTETPAFDAFGIHDSVSDSFKTERNTTSSAVGSYGAPFRADSGIETLDLLRIGSYNSVDICYTSDEVYDTIKKSVITYIENRIGNGLTVEVVDISHPVIADYCMCSNCMAASIEEGHTYSGLSVRFANRLAEELKADYPNIGYMIRANAVPVTIPHENVHITFELYSGCTNHVLSGEDCADTDYTGNRGYAYYLEWWTGVSDNIYVVYHATESPMQQFTVTDNIRQDFWYLHSLGVKSVEWQITYHGLGLQRIEAQLAYLMYWDIGMTSGEYNQNLSRLLEKEYGSGWKNIWKYIDLWNQAQDRSGCWHCFCQKFAGYDRQRYDTDFYASNFNLMVSLFDSAAKSANSKTQERACELLSCHMYYEGTFSSYFEAYYTRNTSRLQILDGRYDRMVEILNKHGFDITEIWTTGGRVISFSEILFESAWRDWHYWRYELYPGATSDDQEGRELIEFCRTVNSRLDDDSLVLAFRSDSHYSSELSQDEKDSFLYTSLNRSNIMRLIDCDLIVHGGDLINGDQSSRALALQSLTEVVSAFRNVRTDTPSIFLRGNHDDNSWNSLINNSTDIYDIYPVNTMVTSSDWRQYAFTNDTENIVMDGTGCYGYMDHEESKIRILLLDTSDIPYINTDGFYEYGSYTANGISEAQLRFMAKALTFSDKGDEASEWAVIVMSHIPVETLRFPESEYRFGGLEMVGRNNMAFLRLLKAYQRGEVFNETQKEPTSHGDGGLKVIKNGYSDDPDDFDYSVYADFSANGPGEVIAFITGHTHIDNFSDEVGKVSYTSSDNKIYPELSYGYPYISVCPGGVASITVERNYDGTGTIYVDKFGTVTVADKSLIADGDNAVPTKDPVAGSAVTSTPDSGSIASGHYTVNYSQNR